MISDGVIAEKGSHDHLVKQGGMFAKWVIDLSTLDLTKTDVSRAQKERLRPGPFDPSHLIEQCHSD